MAKNPIVVIIVPATIGIFDPILEIMNPDVGPNMSKTTEYGI
jgi:hypothetical protein